MGDTQEGNESKAKLSNMETQITQISLNMSWLTISLIDMDNNVFSLVETMTLKKNWHKLPKGSSLSYGEEEH